MDINLAIDQLGLGANSYKLTQSTPPHTITEWSGPDAQPTDAELEARHEKGELMHYLRALEKLMVEQK